jgi:hypothetical protein
MQSQEFLIVEAGGTYSYHWAWKSQEEYYNLNQKVLRPPD